MFSCTNLIFISRSMVDILSLTTSHIRKECLGTKPLNHTSFFHGGFDLGGLVIPKISKFLLLPPEAFHNHSSSHDIIFNKFHFNSVTLVFWLTNPCYAPRIIAYDLSNTDSAAALGGSSLCTRSLLIELSA